MGCNKNLYRMDEIKFFSQLCKLTVKAEGGSVPHNVSLPGIQVTA